MNSQHTRLRPRQRRSRKSKRQAASSVVDIFVNLDFIPASVKAQPQLAESLFLTDFSECPQESRMRAEGALSLACPEPPASLKKPFGAACADAGFLALSYRTSWQDTLGAGVSVVWKERDTTHLIIDISPFGQLPASASELIRISDTDFLRYAKRVLHSVVKRAVHPKGAMLAVSSGVDAKSIALAEGVERL